MKLFLKLWPLMLTLAMCGAPSHAQTGTCGPGRVCRTSAFVTDGAPTPATNAAAVVGSSCVYGNNAMWSWYTATSQGIFGWAPVNGRCGATALTRSLINMTVNTDVVSSATSGGWGAGTEGFVFNQSTPLSQSTGLRLWPQSTVNHLYYTPGSATNARPPVDFGGFQHFALQSRTFAVDMGTEGTTAEWWPRAPRVGGAASTLTFTDAAAAGTATIGATPYARDYRRSNTTATINTVSSFIATPYLDASRGMRWCQRVRVVTASSVRVWAGVGQVLPVGDTPTTHYAAFRFSTAAGDADWRCCSSAGTATCAASNVAPDPVNGNLLCIDCREGAACTYWVDGVAVRRKATDIPTNRVGPLYSVETLTAAARSLDASHISTETN